MLPRARPDVIWGHAAEPVWSRTRHREFGEFCRTGARDGGLGAPTRDRRGRTRSVVLIAGEAGIGKTRLAQELAEAARVRGCRVLSGRCWEVEMGAPPLWPWVEALSDYVPCRWTSSRCGRHFRGRRSAWLKSCLRIHRMLPAVTRPASVDSEDARFQLFGAIADFVRRLSSAEAIPLAGEQPRRAPIPSVSSTLPNPRALVVLLDDLQWAHEASLLFLRYIARGIESMPVLVVGTYRDTPADAHEPLRSRSPSCSANLPSCDCRWRV